MTLTPIVPMEFGFTFFISVGLHSNLQKNLK